MTDRKARYQVVIKFLMGVQTSDRIEEIRGQRGMSDCRPQGIRRREREGNGYRGEGS